MTPRRRAILIVALMLILVGVALFAFFLLRSVVPAAISEPVVEEAVTEVDVPPPPSEPDFVNPLILSAPQTPGRTAAQQMAELFAERYGSYSNQGDYRNLKDLLLVMTARYRQSTEAFLKTAEIASGQTYVGVTSKKVSSTIRDISDDAAVIAVSLQQERTSGGGTPTIGYRTLRMELKRDGEDWRVDAAAWED